MGNGLGGIVCEDAPAAGHTMHDTPAAWHQPAMVASVLRWLSPAPGAVIVDGTAGTGGHSVAIVPRLLPNGRLIAIDRDRDALAVAAKRLTEFSPHVTCLPGNYRHLPQLLESLQIPRINGLLLDLGMSSPQVDRAERGFSFLKEGPLDMRMDPDHDVTAGTLVNRLSASELAGILQTLGEERFAKRITERLVSARGAGPITTTTALAQLVVAAYPPRARHGRLHPATRTFQALRMAVNDELGALEELLGRLSTLLAPGGRVAILTYHSLEDRLVKHAFLRAARDGWGTVLTKKPERPTAEDVARNPRVRSAKLRALERRVE